MIDYKLELKKIIALISPTQIEDHLISISQNLDEKNFAHLFIDSIYLNSVLHFLIDEHWIQSQKSPDEIQFARFIKPFLDSELKKLLFLHSFFLDGDLEDLRVATKSLGQAEKIFIKIIKSKPATFQKKLLQISLQIMSELYEFEHQMNITSEKNNDRAHLSLYRSYDLLDQIFELNYISNETSNPDQKERIYEGSGVGVQSSYATTLLALRYLNLAKGSRFIDLGSGYGRIGLVIGLMRPDIQFTGYEFVKERVDISNKVSAYFDLGQHVHFMSQDLSLANFKIPFAETYYIFDSFTDTSYAIITNQLQEMALHKRITVVTKGNAKLWFKNKYWSEPQEFDNGHLCFFRSKNSMRTT